MVECLLCPRKCQLREGERGDCRVRINLDKKLQTLVYGKPCAVHIDPIEKKPLFHVLPNSYIFSLATAGCNLHCKFCQNWQISQREPEKTRNIDLSPEEIIRQAAATGCKSIAYTYSEPVIFFEYTFDTCKLAHENKLKNVWVTAAFISEKPLREICPYLDAANIDLKSINERYYREICLGELKPILTAIKIAKQEGVWVELTNLVVPTLNDTREEISRLADWVLENLGEETPLHFSRFSPMYQLRNLPPTPVEKLTEARLLAQQKGINYVYVGNVPGHEGNNTYCPRCGKILIERIGYQILQMNIKNGNCKKCQHSIPGIWN